MFLPVAGAIFAMLIACALSQGGSSDSIANNITNNIQTYSTQTPSIDFTSDYILIFCISAYFILIVSFLLSLFFHFKLVKNTEYKSTHKTRKIYLSTSISYKHIKKYDENGELLK